MDAHLRRARSESHHARNRSIVTDSGDRRAIRNRLAETNLPLVHHIVRQLGVQGDEYDDAVGAGMLGLLRACSDWDPDRGASLASYAGIWIRQAAVRHLRSVRPAGVWVTGSDPAGPCDPLTLVSDGEDLADAAVHRLARSQAFIDAIAALGDDVGSTMSVFVAHLGDETGAAAAAGTSIGAWRRHCDRAWSMLRHPAGPCLAGGSGGERAGGYRRWRIVPPVGAFHTRAACRGLGVARFFPARGGQIEAAVAVCDTCPVRSTCADFAVEHAGLCGVWGGTSERERRLARS